MNELMEMNHLFLENWIYINRNIYVAKTRR